jgi:molybdopterin/thiamine biosynthesis adenylyltransferase
MPDMVVASDMEILLLAKEKNIPIGEAAALAIEQGIVPHRYLKNLGVISEKDQARICRTRVLVCGCGGLGGHIVQLLARIGFGSIRVVDPDIFDPSNLNRQPFCMENTLFTSKVLAARKIVRTINPLVQVESSQAPFSPSHLDGVDIVMDGFDNPQDRILAEEEANWRGIPFIHGAVRGWWGQVTTIMPGDTPKLRLLYGGSHNERAEEELGTPVPVAVLIASIQVQEAIRVATLKTPCYSGKLFYWDGETGTSIITPL